MSNSSHLTLVNQQKQSSALNLPDNTTLAERIAYDSAHPSDWFYIHSVLKLYPDRHACAIARRYCAIISSKSRFAANTDLRSWINTFKDCGITISADLPKIEEMAKEKSINCLSSLKWGGPTPEGQYRSLANYCNIQGIEPPEPNQDKGGSKTFEGCVKRMLDKHWWRRKLTKKIQQEREKIAVKLGLISKKKDIYCSREARADNIHQIERNERVLSNLTATDGETSISLADIAKTNISNPEVRYAELMTRLRGFETLVNEADQETIFITVTCPSRMHSSLSKTGRLNPKFDGTSPAEAHKYLQSTWQKARAKLNREKIEIEGYRIAEPHHDGCPHWHLALATDKKNTNALIQIVEDYFKETDPDEKGIENRVKTEFVKSIAGYLSKYISKNIDGKHVDKDFYGKDSKDSAVNVRAWASLWNIRQFQPIGGASVSTYRELRRIREEEKVPERMINVWKAADAGDWAEYEKLQGGLNTNKKNHLILIDKAWSDKLNRFGEKSGSVIIGLSAGLVFLDTRPKTWTIETNKETQKHKDAPELQYINENTPSEADLNTYDLYLQNNSSKPTSQQNQPIETINVQLFTQGQVSTPSGLLSATASKNTQTPVQIPEYYPIEYEDYPEIYNNTHSEHQPTADDYDSYCQFFEPSNHNQESYDKIVA
jgi:hypothetical protein